MHRISLISVVVAAGLMGCATQPAELPVRVTYGPDFNFGELKTFRPASPVAPEARDYPRYQEMARTVVEEELVARGYVRLEDGTPDFRVRTHLRFRNYESLKLGSDKTTGAPTGKKDDIRDATLIVEMLSPIQEEVIWNGSVSGFQLDPFKPRQGIHAAAWRLFVEFPPLW
ncbi:MAG: DUF4136 domain-containing protein [Thermoanaerobaculales bacterium]|nr:DUF4136 domain-containing protein [Thermoanaerobaculales bacterium]